MEKGIKVPSEWKDNDKISEYIKKYCDNVSFTKIINYPSYSKDIEDSKEMTFAMYLAKNGILPP